MEAVTNLSISEVERRQVVSRTIRFRCQTCGLESALTVEDEADLVAMIPVPEECDDCIGRRIAAYRRESESERMERLANDAGIPPAMRRWRPDGGSSETLRAQVSAVAAKSIYLRGHFGCGKTSTICAAAMAEIAAGKTVRYVYYPDFAAAVSDSGGSVAPAAALYRADIIIIDDLGTRERITDCVGDAIVGLVNRAYESRGRQRVWITSNMDSRRLSEVFDNQNAYQRLAGRLSRLDRWGCLSRIAVT